MSGLLTVPSELIEVEKTGHYYRPELFENGDILFHYIGKKVPERHWREKSD